MKIINMRRATKPGNIKAYFSVEHGPFLLHDFKLMESASGLWVSFPKRSYTQGQEKKWTPMVELANPQDKKTIELISAMARDEYLGTK